MISGFLLLSWRAARFSEALGEVKITGTASNTQLLN